MNIYSPEFVDAFDKSGNALPIAGPNPLVMRILCPALIKPEMLGFRLHPRDSLPVGIQIGRFLQQPGQSYLLYETTDINQFPNQTVSFFTNRLCAIHMRTESPWKCKKFITKMFNQMMESAQIQRQKSSQIQEMRALNWRCRTRQVACIIALSMRNPSSTACSCGSEVRLE